MKMNIVPICNDCKMNFALYDEHTWKCPGCEGEIYEEMCGHCRHIGLDVMPVDSLHDHYDIQQYSCPECYEKTKDSWRWKIEITKAA